MDPFIEGLVGFGDRYSDFREKMFDIDGIEERPLRAVCLGDEGAAYVE